MGPPDLAKDRIFESNLEECPHRMADQQDIVIAYNEVANYQGFKLRKHGNTKRIMSLLCIVGRDQPSRYTKSTQLWKQNKVSTYNVVRCKARVSFQRTNDTDEWVRTEVYPYHNHERDMTILPNSIYFAINDFVTQFGQSAQLKLDAMDVISMMESRYPDRVFDYPSLFHYLH